MQSFSKSFDGSMYQAGRNWKDEEGRKVSPNQFVAMQAYNEGVWPEEKTLAKLTNDLIQAHGIPEWAKKRRQQAKELAAHQWILKSYFKDHGVQSDGELADTAEKAFTVVPGQLTVFPFFWDNIIVESLLAMSLLDVFVANVQNVNSGTAVHVSLNETLADRSIALRGEMTTFQEVNVSTVESTVKLVGFGAQISISDEAMRRMALPVLQRFYARYTRQIGIDMTDVGLDILINGDAAYGGAGAAATVVTPAVSGSPSYGDYAKLMMSSDIGYNFTDIVMSRAGWTKLLNIPVFEDPLAGFKFQNEGVLPMPFGLTPHRWDSTKSSSWTSAGVLGDGTTALTIQRDRALAMYQEGGLMTEQDRDARTKSTTVISNWNLIFAILDGNSRRVMTGVS